MVPAEMTAPMFHEEWFGGSSQEAVAGLVARIRHVPGRIIEIGAWEGRSTCAIANAAHPRMVDTCDTWDGSHHEISEQLAKSRDVYAQWVANVAEYTAGNVTAHRMDWREYIPTVTDPVAFVFIDAGHSYREVYDNLVAVVPLLVPGAIVCGDDMHHGPIQDAVFDMFGTDDVYVTESLWVWQAPDNQPDMDRVRLRARHRGLAPTDHEWVCDLDRVARIWRSYVREVSSHDMAVSPGTAAYLYRLCDVVQPERILDLGSGLSSAVFRKWAAERCQSVPHIVSVDDDVEWLDRTREFLERNELSTDGLHLYGDVEVEPGSFDVVFHDFAGGVIRDEVAEVAVRAVKPGGVIVFDDAHFDEHVAVFERVAGEHGITLYSLAKWTFDAIGRFSLIGFKDDGVSVVSSSLAEAYVRLCHTPSDIHLHLPRFVYLVEKMRPEHVVELGARSGVSTTGWLYGLEGTGGRLTTVDMDVAPAIGSHGNWVHIQGDDTDPDVVAQVDDCDILFIDTSHAFEHTLWELRTWGAKVRAGGLILCHDTELERPWDPPCPATDPDFPVKMAVRTFCDETGFRWINIPECWGLAIIEVV
jgi:predicted O-methyltransferase YrrM